MIILNIALAKAINTSIALSNYHTELKNGSNAEQKSQ